MVERRSQFALRLLPSTADLAFLMPLVFLFGRMGGATALLSDCDAGWHIRTGEWILANGRVPAHDLFSFSKAGEPWYAWEWLSDVVWAWLYRSGGLAALTLFCALLLAVVFGIVYRLAARRANPVVALLVTMFAAAASSVHWLARPHLFTLLFVAAFYGVLDRARSGGGRIPGVPRLVLLPAAMVAWTNLHGGFFVGVILVGAFAAAEFLRAALSADEEERRGAMLAGRRFGWTALACAGATLVNPYGYGLHLHLLRYLRDPFQTEHIGEFLSPNFQHPAAIFFEALLLLGGVAAVRLARRGRYAEPMLIVLWAHGALLATRNIPIYAIIAAAPAAAALQHGLQALPQSRMAGWMRRAAARLNGILAGFGELDAAPRWRLASVAGAVVVAALLFAPTPPANFQARFDPKLYPSAAIETLRSSLPARIFTNDEWGDYLIYALYPEARVFIDGRSDFYGADFEEEVLAVRNVKFGWERTLNRFSIDTILSPAATALSGALKESRSWRLVHDDGVALVFRRADPVAETRYPASIPGGGTCRDREITKTETSDLRITQTKSKI